MFRSVFHGDTNPLAVLKLKSTTSPLLGIKENAGPWKGTFETPGLLVVLGLSTERQCQDTETTRIPGKRWEGKGENLLIISGNWGWHRSCIRVIMSINFSTPWIKSDISACCLTAASFVLFFLTPFGIYSSFIDVPCVPTCCLWSYGFKGVKFYSSLVFKLCLIWGQCKGEISDRNFWHAFML